MQCVVFLVSPLVTAALVIAFGWPILIAGFALALCTLVFSTAARAEEAPMALTAESSGPHCPRTAA
jgi:hypothetical protein